MLEKEASPLLPVLLVSLTIATTSLIYYWFNKKNEKTSFTASKVNKLLIYPIKALKGVEVNSLEITGDVVKYGIFRDRTWVLLDQSDQFIALKHEPTLALTKCSFHNNELWVEAPDMPTLKLTYVEDLDSAQILTFKIFGKVMKGINCGQDVHNWFCTYLGKPGIRLAQYHQSFGPRDTYSRQRIKDEKKFPIIYQNKSTLHLVNQSSVNDLNSRLSVGSDEIVYHNFRPNILVDYPKPWDEDLWKYMSINGVKFVRLFVCDRCPNTTINQNTGRKGLQTVIALNKFRSAKGKAKERGFGPGFGVLYGPLTKGVINVDDVIQVTYGALDYNFY